MTRARSLTLLAALSTVLAYLQATLGAVVRVSGSGEGCPGWPLCGGHPYPAANAHSIIEFAHRTNGTLLGLAVLATTAVVWVGFRPRRRLILLSTAALLLVTFEGAIGGTVVFAELAGALVMFHFSIALVILGLLIALALGLEEDGIGIPDPSFRRRIGVGTGLAFVLLLTGSSVVASGAEDSCLAWPLCGNGFQLNLQGANTFNVLHRAVVLVVAIFLLQVAWSAWRRWREIPGIAAASSLVVGALVAQVLVGLLVTLSHDSAFSAGLHVTLAVAVWAGMVSLVVVSYRGVSEAGVRSLSLQQRTT